MKDGICPKCSGREVYRRDGSRFANEMIELKGDFISQGAAPDKYLCATCGYLEYYLPITEKIEMVRENWDRVPAQ